MAGDSPKQHLEKVKSSLQGVQAENLRLQSNFLEAAMTWHKLCAEGNDNPDVTPMHNEAIGLLQKAKDKIDSILENFHS
ncbi:MAG TPA: hypothetical protein V6C97_32925 [Oculatellaceae cyanobacterium]